MVSDGYYEKHAIYSGNLDGEEYAIYMAENENEFIDGCIVATRLEKFLFGYEEYKYFTYNEESSCYSPLDIVNRAVSQISKEGEITSFQNSKEFTEWCINGEPREEDKWSWNVYHVKASRGTYDHHGIYLGKYDGEDIVIHYSGFSKAFAKGEISLTTLSEFQGNADAIYVVEYSDSEQNFSKFEIIDRAFSKLGEDEYNLFSNNCEHFACWCITGKNESKQVESVRKSTITSLMILDDIGLVSVSPLTLNSLGASKKTVAMHAISKYLIPGVTPVVVTAGATLLSKIFKR